MALKTKEKQIDGLQFAVTQLPARKSLSLQLKLSRIIIPFVGKLAEGSDLGKSDNEKEDVSILDANIEGLGEAFENALEKLGETKFFELVYEIFAHTRVDGREINSSTFDTVFESNLLAMYKGIAFVLEVEYGRFLGVGGIGSLLSKAGKTIPANMQKK